MKGEAGGGSKGDILAIYIIIVYTNDTKYGEQLVNGVMKRGNRDVTIRQAHHSISIPSVSDSIGH